MHGVAKRLLLGFVIMACALALTASMVNAAATGQIKGRLVDKDTKEPIIGASVMIVGTKFGAMTDPDGNFIITRLDPNTYTVRISGVGYNTIEVKDVLVKSDLTTEVSQKLEKTITDIGKTITVTAANQDAIQKYETSNQVSITSQAIQTKPVQNVDQLIRQVAGVQTNAFGQVFIRGGRAGEVSYIVDGVPVNDNLGGTGANLSLVSGSIQEIQIIKDGFDPEYGNALSGIVKVTSQTGNKDNTRINLQYLTDDLGTAKLNDYSRNYDFARFSVSGPDPFVTTKVLPAFGLKFLADKEFTYYVYGEMEKHNGIFQYDAFDSPTTRREWGGLNFFGLDLPGRKFNRYFWQSNFKFRPKQNLNFVLSYKYSNTNNTAFDWNYRYSSANAPVVTDLWKSLSLEVSQMVSKNMNYEAIFSYFEKRATTQPGDPNNPGHGLNPDQFRLESEWEDYTDRNDNGRYDAPEPIINLYPDSMSYGTGVSGPAYTFGEWFFDRNAQTGATPTLTNFRFNNNGIRDSLEGEPFIDLNGNGVWDAGDFLNDKNGNGKLDQDRISPINRRDPEPFVDGDSIRGEPYTDVNNNSRYDNGIDYFVRSADPTINQDLNHNGIHDGPENMTPYEWEPGIPYFDRNSNGIFDLPNGLYDAGERFTDVNGNGEYDYGGASNFLNPGTYDSDINWHQHSTKTYRAEVKGFRQMGAHEFKGGFALAHDDFNYEDITRGYLPFTGRVTVDENGNPVEPYPTRGIYRDFFTYKPWNGTVYLRDKIEYGSMIANIGIRWDFFLQDAAALVPIVKGDDIGSGVIFGDRQRLSPRIGFSYPISDKAKVHFNYGHFYQLPEYQYMYARNTANVDQNAVVGNYNLDYQKTVQYSFGVKYAMSESYAVDVSGYFKDEFDKINQQRMTVGKRKVNQYTNRDYGRSRGFELTLEKRGGGYVNGDLNYTYAFAFGKASQTSEGYLTDFQLSREPLNEAALDNDIRHSLKSSIQIYIPNSVKPRLFGLPIPNGWSLDISAIVESGRPFTPDAKYPNLDVSSTESIERNSLRYPATAVFDMQFKKEFRFAGIDYQFILWVDNIFNTRNVVNIYTTTGRADTQQNQNGTILQGTQYDQNPGNWDYGRQVRVGLEVNL